MAQFRKLNVAEIAALEQRPPGVRAQVAREFDAYLADFAAGDYGRADLAADERRTVVRGRLQAAARRRGLALRFRPGRGPLIFHVEATPPTVARPAPTPQERVGAALRGRLVVDAPVAAQRPPRPPRRPPTAAERYHKVLPRWMREGQPGRPTGSRRRT